MLKTFGIFAVMAVGQVALAAPVETLLVLSKGERTLALVDPAKGSVIAKIPVGDDPHEVVASSDGKLAYVSNYGSGALHTLTVVNLITRKPAGTVELGALRGPHGLAYVGDKVWFTAEAARAVGSWDPAKRSIDWILGTGQDRTHMIFVTADQQKIFTTNVNSGSVTIIEKSARPPEHHAPPGSTWDETVIKVGDGAEGFDVSPNGKQLWTANAQDGTVSVIDIAGKKVTDTLHVNVPRANRLKFTPDGKQVLISLLGGTQLVVIDATSRLELKRVELGAGAAGIVVQPDSARAYVACTGSDYVAIIDLKTLSVAGKISAGPQPDGLAWSIRAK